jgi:hypothetical protein
MSQTKTLEVRTNLSECVSPGSTTQRRHHCMPSKDTSGIGMRSIAYKMHSPHIFRRSKIFVWEKCIFYLSRTAVGNSSHFFDNLHFEHFDKRVNLDSWLTLLSKCSKWRLSKKWDELPTASPERIFCNDEPILCSPNEDFGRREQKMKCVCSIEFSTIRSQNRVLTTLKSASNIRISSFVPPSKIFVWEG